jgi:hypothetical protein
MRPRLLDSPWVADPACFHAFNAIGSSIVPKTYRYVSVYSPMQRITFRVPSTRTVCRPFSLHASYQGLCPLSTSLMSVHIYGVFHHSASFRPQAFTTSRRLSPLPSLYVYFTAQPITGLFSVQGLSLSTQSRLLIANRYPHAVESQLPHLPKQTTRCWDLDSEVLPRVEARIGDSVVNLFVDHSPLRFPSPPGRPYSPVNSITRIQSLMTLSNSVSSHASTTRHGARPSSASCQRLVRTYHLWCARPARAFQPSYHSYKEQTLAPNRCA